MNSIETKLVDALKLLSSAAVQLAQATNSRDPACYVELRPERATRVIDLTRRIAALDDAGIDAVADYVDRVRSTAAC